MRLWRFLWLALVPVLVVPLYGQGTISCNRSCPPSANPCQRLVGRSIETNECTYTDTNGVICDYQDGAGVCSDGQCLPTECMGVEAYESCDDPLGGGSAGVCVEDLCVAAAPDDECVIVRAGRINCCSQEGCADANGMICADPLDGVPCDPTGVEPAGDPAQTGICDNGTCVAQSGPCDQVLCPNAQCTRQDCDPTTGQCEGYIPAFISCEASTGISGVCHWGQCTLR